MILVVGIFTVIWFAIQWISSKYKEYCWDGISVIVLIISMALVLFFGDWIKQDEGVYSLVVLYLAMISELVLIYVVV